MCSQRRDTGLRMAAECHTAPLEAVKGAVGGHMTQPKPVSMVLKKFH